MLLFCNPPPSKTSLDSKQLNLFMAPLSCLQMFPASFRLLVLPLPCSLSDLFSRARCPVPAQRFAQLEGSMSSLWKGAPSNRPLLNILLPPSLISAPSSHASFFQFACNLRTSSALSPPIAATFLIVCPFHSLYLLSPLFVPEFPF